MYNQRSCRTRLRNQLYRQNPRALGVGLQVYLRVSGILKMKTYIANPTKHLVLEIRLTVPDLRECWLCLGVR